MEELKQASTQEQKYTINNTDKQTSFKLKTIQEPNSPENILFDFSLEINNSADQAAKDEFVSVKERQQDGMARLPPILS